MRRSKQDNFFIILAENISRNEINEYLKDAQEKLVLKIIK